MGRDVSEIRQRTSQPGGVLVGWLGLVVRARPAKPSMHYPEIRSESALADHYASCSILLTICCKMQMGLRNELLRGLKGCVDGGEISDGRPYNRPYQHSTLPDVSQG